MREIKFRGRGAPRGKQWFYGDLDTHTSGFCILDNDTLHTVISDTVGQYTGLSDSEGREIYEGDVIKLGNEVYTVSWAKYSACWFVDLKNFGPSLFTQYHAGKSIVIGNIYDNPELLENTR